MSPLAIATPYLSPWAPWLVPALEVFAALVAASCGTLVSARLASRKLRALPADLAWPERARLATSVRAAAMASSAGAIALSAIGGDMLLGPFHAPTHLELGVALGGAALFGALLVGGRIDAWIGQRPRPLLVRLRDLAARLVVLYPHLFVAIFAFAALHVIDAPWWERLLTVLAIGVLPWLGLGVLVARALGLVRPASERLTKAVARVVSEIDATPSMRAGTRHDKLDLRPRAYEMRISVANAFALPLAHTLLVTEGALAVLDDTELEAILAHELGHLTEPPLLAWMRVMPLLTFVALGLLALPPLQHLIPDPWAPLAPVGLLLLFVVVLRVLVLPLTNGLEKRADAIAHRARGEEGLYARALAKLYQANLVPVVSGRKRGTHPDLYDRLVAAGAPPDYPRPAPPPRAMRPALLAVLLVYLFARAPFDVTIFALDSITGLSPAQLTAREMVLGDAVSIGEMARLAYDDEELTRSERLYSAAAEASPKSVAYPAYAAMASAQLVLCSDARAHLTEAEHRYWAHGKDHRGGEALALGEGAVQSHCPDADADDSPD